MVCQSTLQTIIPEIEIMQEQTSKNDDYYAYWCCNSQSGKVKSKVGGEFTKWDAGRKADVWLVFFPSVFPLSFCC